jgi:hypothetical protein
MYENHLPETGKYNIRRPRKFTAVKSKAIAERMRQTSDNNFGARIFAPNPGHHRRSFNTRQSVNHGASVARYCPLVRRPPEPGCDSTRLDTSERDRKTWSAGECSARQRTASSMIRGIGNFPDTYRRMLRSLMPSNRAKPT